MGMQIPGAKNITSKNKVTILIIYLQKCTDLSLLNCSELISSPFV